MANANSQDWQISDDRLIKTFTFTDFDQAWSFMTRVAELAKKLDHHPKWTNEHNRVSFELSTHSAGNTVTDLDHRLAQAIDQIAV